MIINGNLNLYSSTIESLGDISEINGTLSLYGCRNLKSLGQLERINGKILLDGCEKLESFGKLRSIHITKKNFYDNNNILVFNNLPNLKSFGELEELKGIDVFEISNCPNFKSLGKLKSIGWIKRFSIINCQNLTSLGELKWFPVNEVNLKYSNIKKIKEYSDFTYNLDLSQNNFIEVIEKHVSIRVNLNLSNSSIKKIDRDCSFGILNISNCKNLKSLGRDLKIKDKLIIEGSGITEKYLKKYHPELLKVLVK